jgi:vacuolar-type H+-ATPase subunit E/Vma4
MDDRYKQNLSVNEKLRSFTDMALREAYKKKNEIIENTEKVIRETLKSREIELLEEAYRNMQTGTRQNRRELNDSLSKALVEGKRRMFEKRRTIISEVFKQVREKLDIYRTTPEYPIKIMNDIMEGFAIIGDSTYEIEINGDEKDLFEKLIAEAGLPVSIRISEDDIGGGFIMNGVTKRIRVDCSLAAAEQEARDKFLEMIRMPIEDGDLLDEQL